MTAPDFPLRTAILASGGGSNLQAIVDHLDQLGDARAARIVLIASDRPDCGALKKARAQHIESAVIGAPADGAALLALLAAHRIELVVLAGYLKLVPGQVTRHFAGRMLNIHPALLPKFGGAGMYGRRVHEAVIAAGETESGATVHQVSEEFDRGEIIAQQRVRVEKSDTPETLAARVLVAEHALYPRTVQDVAARLSRKSHSA
jgi:formyltetrahydrofolate-dependent phosphoribosylglycinamide formyltransferase